MKKNCNLNHVEKDHDLSHKIVERWKNLMGESHHI